MMTFPAPPPIIAAITPAAAPPPPADYPIQPVPFTQVHFADDFWSPRIEINRTVTIPYAFSKCEETGRIHNFERAAAVLRGETVADLTPPGFPFDDSDLYKIIEGASFSLSIHPDPKMETYLDSLISKIAAAQEPDGYLYTTRTINPAHPHPWSGTERWVSEEQASHELYNLGHLFEAAAAHYQGSGKRTLLDVALKSADMLYRTFGPEKRTIWPGHQIVEMGLVRLYRITGEARYLNLARFFLDIRKGGGEYAQANKPVIEQTEAVGHAVRATYMYSGMADVAALTGDSAYMRALDNIWSDVTDRKLYITGGIGATSAGEAFGAPFELPNDTAYCETCAAIGNVYWNERLFLLHGDSRYIDVLERTLYNGLLSGVSLDGKSFFYPNPLTSDGGYARSPWFGCACCPGNLTRFLASVPGYQYAHTGDSIYVNLFASGTATIPLGGGHTVSLKQETRYPWNGDIRLTLLPGDTVEAKPLALMVRIPGWARGEALPSSLYHFANSESGVDEKPTVTVNGQPVTISIVNGYARLSRVWKSGDVVMLHLPMPIRRVQASEKVAADRGRIALQRGPLVFCLEGVDSSDGQVSHLLLPNETPLTASFHPELLGGVVALQGNGLAVKVDAHSDIVTTDAGLFAVPYFAWANRGKGEMQVWIADNTETATGPKLIGAPVVGGAQ